MPYCVGVDGRTHSRYETGVQCRPEGAHTGKHHIAGLFFVFVVIFLVVITFLLMALNSLWDRTSKEKRKPGSEKS